MPSTEPLDGDAGDRPDAATTDDLFYRGTLIRLARGGHRGVVRSASTGREVPFELQHVTLLGERGPSGVVDLREGMAVGYDVGWTSRGLRVTKLFPLRSS